MRDRRDVLLALKEQTQTITHNNTLFFSRFCFLPTFSPSLLSHRTAGAPSALCTVTPPLICYFLFLLPGSLSLPISAFSLSATILLSFFLVHSFIAAGYTENNQVSSHFQNKPLWPNEKPWVSQEHAPLYCECGERPGPLQTNSHVPASNSFISIKHLWYIINSIQHFKLMYTDQIYTNNLPQPFLTFL